MAFLQGLVKLLASNPADKEVLQATAKALKQMTAERPVYETVQRSGSRWLRVLSRQGSAFVFERLGVKVSSGVFSILIVVVVAGAFLSSLSLLAKGSRKPASAEKKLH